MTVNKELLEKHIKNYVQRISNSESQLLNDLQERNSRVPFYQNWSRDRILEMTPDDFYEYISNLWSMLIWGNKHYVVDKILQKHGIKTVQKELAEFVWGTKTVAERWDRFRNHIKGLGPASMSEILAHVFPDTCMVWNRRALAGLSYLGFENLPRYDYQVTGNKYIELIEAASLIRSELEQQGVQNATLLTVDYFIWHELQVEEKLSQINKKVKTQTVPAPKEKDVTSEFVHDDIRDKIADIGKWLGFDPRTEIKIADGSKVDAAWEATIGNMGRVIYIFEVQTRGSIDSLILNLLKSLNNPAVQGVVAVSDENQLQKIKKHVSNVPNLNEKLRYWDYENVLQVYESLSLVNESINKLNLVPEGFWG